MPEVTFENVMAAAGRAHQAGRQDHAKQLVDYARTLPGYEAYKPKVAQTPPRADEWEATPQKPDRFGDTIEAATKGPVAATQHYARQTVAPDRTISQRAGDAAMTGLSGLATGISFGAGLAGEIAGGSPTGEKKLARDLLMASEVAVPELAGVSSTTRLAGAAAKGAKKPATAAQTRARAAADVGVTPSLGMSGKTPAMISGALESVPVAGGVIAKDAARAVGEIEGAFRNAVAKLGDAETPALAGDRLQGSLIKWRDNFKSRADKMFSDVSKHLPPETKVETPNFVSAIEESRALFQSNPELAKKLGVDGWAGVANEARANGMSWQAIREFRTSVGEAIGKVSGTLSDDNTRRLNQIYGALTEDMGAAAQAAGPDALKAWEGANRFYKRGAEKLSKSLDKTISADSPERAFEAFANMAKDGRSTSDVRRMREIKTAAGPQEWRSISASIIDRLGRAKPGAQTADGDAFSAVSFLTEWNKMSKEAKAILLPKETRNQLNQLATVAESAREAGAHVNNSRSGTVAGSMALGGGLATAPIATLSALGGAVLSAAFLTNPRVLRAINKAARGDTRQLAIIAGKKGPFMQDAQTVLRLYAAEMAANSGEQPRAAAQ